MELKHTETEQVCTFQDKEAAGNFLSNVTDPDNWAPVVHAEVIPAPDGGDDTQAPASTEPVMTAADLAALRSEGTEGNENAAMAPADGVATDPATAG